MIRRRRGAGLRITAAALLAVTTLTYSDFAAPAAADPAVPGGPTNERLLEVAELRGWLGLPNSPADVRASFSSPRYRVNGFFDIPLSPEELAIIAADDRVGSQVEAASREFAGDRAFGGAVYDPATHTLTVNVIGPVDPSLIGRFAARLGHSGTVRTAPAAVPMADLEATAARVNEVVGSDPRGVGRSVSFRPDINAVVVEVRPGADPRAVQRLRDLGPGVVIEESAAEAVRTDTRYDTATPVRGGKQLPLPDGQTWCSASIGGIGGNGYYLITAGHCGPRGTVFRFGGGNPIGSLPAANLGPVVNNSFYESGVANQSDCDCAVIGPISYAAATATYFLSVSTSYFTSVAYETATATSFYTNRAVCKSGATSGYTCGVITNPHWSLWDSAGHYHHEAVRASANQCAGDSGGTVGSGNMYMGVANLGAGGVYGYTRGQPCYNDLGFQRGSLLASRVGVAPMTGTH